MFRDRPTHTGANRRRLFDEVARIVAAPPHSWAFSIGLALTLVALSTLIRMALAGVVGTGQPFSLFYWAVTVASVLGGFRAGAVALAAAAAAGWYFFIPPPWAFARLDEANTTALAIFVASSGLEGLIAATLRHALLRLADRERDLRLIADELRHRVKNVLALVQSVARRTVQTAPDLAGFQAAFEARLKALARVHDILGRSGWAGAGMRDLIGAHLDPFVSPDGPRLRLDGEDLTLAPDTAVSLSLVLHELATNAVKYGCLSTPAGELNLSWRRRPGGEALVLDWLERGGPPVEKPARNGFGATLLARALARDDCIDFDPAGLHVVASFPLPALPGDGRAQPTPGRRRAGRAGDGRG